MFAHGSQHDHAHARVFVQRLEYHAELIALPHLDDVKRRPVEHHVGALARGVDFDAKAVELLVLQTRIGQRAHAAVPCWRVGEAGSAVYSPATSLRRRSFPTGDFGISLTNT